LERDYTEACEALSARFGTPFSVASTAGGCYAITTTLETGDLVLITDAADTTLNTLDETEGFSVGVYAETDTGNEPLVYVSDAQRSLSRLPDLFAHALHKRAAEGMTG